MKQSGRKNKQKTPICANYSPGHIKTPGTTFMVALGPNHLEDKPGLPAFSK